MSFFISLFLSTTALAQTSVLDRFRVQPNEYRCSAVSDADICVTKNRIQSPKTGFQYSKQVAFVIPRTVPAITSPDSIMMHLQGWRGVCSGGADVNFTPEQTLQAFNLPSQFVDAITRTRRSNSILVFPVSYGYNDDYKNQLLGRFGEFGDWVDEALTSTPTSGWYISGHSGAGAIMASGISGSIRTIRRLRGVILLDATYGSSETHWAKVARLSPKLLVQSIYIPGTGTATGSVDLQNHLNGLGILVHPVKLTKSTTHHCNVPNQYFGAALETALITNR